MEKRTSEFVTTTVFKKAIKKIDNRFDGIDTRLNGIDTRLDGIDTRLDGIDARFDGVNDQFKSIDMRFDGLDATIARMGAAIVSNTADIKEIKETMMTRADGQKILQVVESLASKYEEADRARQIHLNQVIEFRPQLEDHEKRLTVLESQAHP